MAVTSQTLTRPAGSRINEIIRASGEKDGALEKFADLFFDCSEDSEFDAYREESLAELLLSAWRFVSERGSDATHKIRVANPDNLQSDYGKITVVEILNDDMPFLVDSIMGEIQERGHTVHLVSHPVFDVVRGESGIVDLGPPAETRGAGAKRESYIHIHLAGIEEASARDELRDVLSQILDDVRTVVADWKLMTDRLNRAIAAYTASPPPVPVSDLAESIQFLKWLLDNNFTFLGMRALAYVGGEKKGHLEPVPRSGLGILRDRDVLVLRRGDELVHMTPEIRQFFLAPAPLIITKANVRSVVHRRTHMDYIGVKIYAESGEISGELRIVGLFTSTAYTRSTRNIPFLRHKVDLVFERSGYSHSSHSGKALANILETFPRDELFQIDVDQLYETVMGILSLELRPRTRIFSRIDKFDRFVSVLVYVPRDRFTTDVRTRIGEHLAQAYNGRVSVYYLFFPEGPLVRIHYIIGRYTSDTPQPDQAELEAEVAAIARTWGDELRAALRDQGKSALGERYATAFSPAYQGALTPERAVEDIDEFEALSPDNPIAIRFYRQDGEQDNRAHVALYSLAGSIPLSRRVPVLENLGFAVIDERSYQVRPEPAEGDTTLALHDMVVETRDGSPIEPGASTDRLEDGFLAVWRGQAGNDPYNRLIRAADIDWRETAAVRGYGSYLRQIGAPFGQAYLSDTLIRHSGVARDLVELFRIRFDPDADGDLKQREAAGAEVVDRIEEALESIPSLDEDRIIRHFLNLVQTTLRTNFYQRDESGAPAQAIAFKFDSARVEGAPSPRPFVEIFVFSPRVEGIHLRGGKIARGGLRWSDRAQDFRTEVLGLAKAQQVKNVVIVPTGSKGGFVPKFLPEGGTREEILEEGVATYKLFVSTLLSITDNLVKGDVVPPGRVVRHDGDDPYLVVAADKGTATFSDFANEISIEHGFWLGDAFASGGSAGYDHKKMAITARGAWEAVKRHFREMNVDIQSEPFTAIGIGDMSGDVFGNGMLLSKETRLLAAFDHRDIFIDPDPDAAASWKERKRLFELPRSSWQDYDTGVISEGGGVFSRAAKSIDLTPQIRDWLGIEAAAVTPNELVRAILKARADLLWFGGIGTYVAAAQETTDQIGDRANDSVRIRAEELNVKVIGEGANLGMTQEARIQFARRGGRVNTDAIDNSAGVNSSDLEVNIKIALGSAVAADKLDIPARNELLVEMTEEVAEKCLRNNYLQTLAISIGERNGVSDIGFQGRLMRSLERRGLLDREIEFLPDDAELEERRLAGDGLSRPELAVLLAYGKIDLYNALISSQVPDDPFFESELLAYFPKTLQERFRDEIKSHQLRREIIATRLSNAIINRGGSTMFVRLKEETGHSADSVALAFTAARAVFDVETLYRSIDALDNRISGELQLSLYARLQRLLRQQTAWFLRNGNFRDGLSALTEAYGGGVEQVRGALAQVLTPDQRATFDEERTALVEQSVPEALAESLASLRFLSDVPEMQLVAAHSGTPILDVVKIYGSVTGYFRLTTLKSRAEALLVTDYFDRLAINSTIAALSAAQRSIVEDIVGAGPEQSAANGFENWLASTGEQAERTRRAIDEVLDGEFTLSKLMVAVGHLGDLSGP